MGIATKFSCLLQATCTRVFKENLQIHMQIYKEASCWNGKTMKVYIIYFQMFHTWSNVSYNFNNGDTLRLKHLKMGFFPCPIFLMLFIPQSKHVQVLPLSLMRYNFHLWVSSSLSTSF